MVGLNDLSGHPQQSQETDESFNNQLDAVHWVDESIDVSEIRSHQESIAPDNRQEQSNEADLGRLDAFSLDLEVSNIISEGDDEELRKLSEDAVWRTP